MSSIKRIFTNVSMFALGAVLLASCGGGEATEPDAEQTSNVKRLPVVSTTSVSPERFEHFFQVQGVVETDKNAQIFPEVPGRITSIRVQEGDKVAKGDVLLTIDSRVMQNNITELENQLALAETVFQKQKNLWDQKIGSEIQFLEARTQRDGLVKSLETARSQLDLYSIRAPFSGFVDEVSPKVGENTNPAMPVMRLLNLDEVYIKADVTESYIGKINEGDSVVVEFPSLGRKISTQISRIGSFINPNNRTFKVTVNMHNGSGMLKPNMLAKVHIMDYASDSALVVPASMVQQDSEGNDFLMVVDESEGSKLARKQIVSTGKTYMGKTQVVKGLMGKEMLINKGGRIVKDGDLIELQG